MAQDDVRQSAEDGVFDDPKGTPKKDRILNSHITRAFFHDGSATGGPLWEKAKDLTRSDLWALSGFGTTTAFDNWSVEELNLLGAALGAYLGKPYMGAKYICCTCC